ncbi:hypothetical protein TanjilG_06388 [Lupinus angustifolius]|uniref:Uncharacterized protein n=1 Tax=Lupinus angustifolius TaxID=3871 RepID=A0A4P1RW19_LUPAN|nr:hypothetical protein TanjilG_06388 [Lupinus angustifolius]
MGYEKRVRKLFTSSQVTITIRLRHCDSKRNRTTVPHHDHRDDRGEPPSETRIWNNRITSLVADTNQAKGEKGLEKRKVRDCEIPLGFWGSKESVCTPFAAVDEGWRGELGIGFP